MKVYHELVFADSVEGTTSVYTNPQWNDLLAVTETIVLVVYATQASGTGPLLTVQSQLSGDERNWVSAQLNPEISAQVLSTSAQTSLSGIVSSATPGTGFRRFQITLGGTAPKAYLRIFATGRGDQPWLGNTSREA